MSPPPTSNSQSGLIRRRLGPRRSLLAKLLEDAKKIQDEAIADEDENAVSNIELIVAKLETTAEKIESDDQAWTQLIAALPDEERSSGEDIYSYWATDEDEGKPFLFLADNAVALVKSLKSKLDRYRIRTAPVPGTPIDEDVSNTSGVRVRRSAKLRTLELPTFNGDPLTFKFWSLFLANVHEENYDNITKFSYLRQQLRGMARDTIAGLEITSENYDVAVQLLHDRFEKTTPEIIGTLYSKLKLMQRSTDNPHSLHKTYDTVQKIIRQLKNAGADVESNQLLVMDILGKFPESVIKEITVRKNVDVRSTVEETEKAIEQYIQQMELLTGTVSDF